jgi:hypothetical protein
MQFLCQRDKARNTKITDSLTDNYSQGFHPASKLLISTLYDAVVSGRYAFLLKSIPACPCISLKIYITSGTLIPKFVALILSV